MRGNLSTEADHSGCYMDRPAQPESTPGTRFVQQARLALGRVRLDGGHAPPGTAQAGEAVGPA